MQVNHRWSAGAFTGSLICKYAHAKRERWLLLRGAAIYRRLLERRDVFCPDGKACPQRFRFECLGPRGTISAAVKVFKMRRLAECRRF
jgi:hypothetical protein